jgi:hypothetical protein
MTTTSPGAPLEPTISAVPTEASPLIARKAARPRTNTILMAAAVFVAVAGVAFAVGRLTAPTAAAASRFGANGTFAGGFGNGNGGTGGAGFRGIGGGGVTLEGTVTALGNGTITLQTANGQTITVDTSSGTTYHAQAAATASQVAVGTKVLVRTTFSRPAGTAGGTQALPGANGGAVQGGVPNGGFESRTFTASDVTIAQ